MQFTALQTVSNVQAHVVTMQKCIMCNTVQPYGGLRRRRRQPLWLDLNKQKRKGHVHKNLADLTGIKLKKKKKPYDAKRHYSY